MSISRKGVRAISVATAFAALAVTASVTTPANATDGIAGYAICHAGPGPAPVYRTTTSPWTRIYTIPVNGAMHVDKFVRINGVTLAYGHGFNKPNGWTNAHNFNRCIA